MNVCRFVSVCLLVAVAVCLCGCTSVTSAVPTKEEAYLLIDPGHGGEDGGAISRSGLPESTYNLEISQKLQDLLNLLGHQTKMIRTSDISVYTKGETLAQKKASDLKERVNFANNTPGAILVSIHQNHFPDDRYSGAQVFYAKTHGSQKHSNTNLAYHQVSTTSGISDDMELWSKATHQYCYYQRTAC